jgi:hypothetical protein
LTESFMANEDSTDKLREMWAFNLPCALLVNSPSYWPKLKPVYTEIFKDLQLSVKRSLAASLIEVCKIHLDQEFMLEVITFFLLCDLEEVKQKIVPNLVDLVKLYPSEKQMELVSLFIKPQLVSKSLFHNSLLGNECLELKTETNPVHTDKQHVY